MNASGAGFALALGMGAACLWVGAVCGETCGARVIGVDPAVADTTVEAFFCRGFGQTFVAADTLVQSISIWRPALPALDGQPRYLFITETDSLGKPDIRRVLLAGLSLVRLVGDGTHPVEYAFLFEPPFALPRRGEFFFDIQADANGAFEIGLSSRGV